MSPPARGAGSPETSVRQKIALVLFGLGLTFVLLEAGLRAGGWLFVWLQGRGNATALRGASRVVLCIGESTTALGGGGSYPRQLEAVLARFTRGRGTSVVNEGVPGTNTDAILARVPGLLARYNPDIVVAMIGINDPIEDVAPPPPVAAWFASLRAVKLARLAATRVVAQWRGEGPDAPLVAVDSTVAEARLRARLAAEPTDDAAFADLVGLYVAERRDADARAVLATASAEGPAHDLARLLGAVLGDPPGDVPGESDVVTELARVFEPGSHSAVLVQAISNSPTPGVVHDFIRRAVVTAAETLTRGGKVDDAASLERRFVLIRGKPVDDIYYGWLARLALAAGDFDEFEHDLAVAESLRPPGGRPMTARNYRALRRLLADRDIALVAVQYPLRKVDVLRRMLEDDRSVVIVDNDWAFRNALRKVPYERLFTDSFAGDFGHMTDEGNRLLAEDVAGAILARLSTRFHPPAKGASR